MTTRALGLGLVLAFGVAGVLTLGLVFDGVAQSPREASQSAEVVPASSQSFGGAPARADQSARREPVATLSGTRAELAVDDIVRARETLDRGRQGALAELRRVAEASSDSLQQSAEVLALQAKLLKYEHSLVLLAEGGCRTNATGRPVPRRNGHEYLIMHSFGRTDSGAYDLVFDYELAAERFTDLRVTIEDLRIVQRRVEVDAVRHFNARDEAERRAALDQHANAVRGHAELMQSIARLAPTEHRERELLSHQAAALSGQMLPWHFIVTPGATTVSSRLESRP